jgi:membrane protease subunit (stomatin/prohibitin family)
MSDKPEKTNDEALRHSALEEEGADAGAITRTCESCGAAVGEAKFCPECATPTAPPRLTCSGCGQQPEGKPKFCPECGAEMPSAC